MDGESMSDWFTGSANVLIKTFIRFVFGLQPSLDGLVVQPAAYIPFENCSIKLRIKQCLVTLQYRKEGRGKRAFFVNGTEYKPESGGIHADKIILHEEMRNLQKLLISVVD